ncbi:uncharacterized protein LOC132700075 [Cylas formicarius]|uniref:uncharacterized protein LOC132700075 n=1 Tax=Cylas formicarius TaxID=197179 RepID=UPI0029588C4E|nr:uncharacterized protein LOC132700075 [Cylas formicarius]
MQLDSGSVRYREQRVKYFSWTTLCTPLTMFWLIVFILAVVILWFLLDKPLHYWERLGAKQTKPWIVLGDSWSTVLGLKNFSDLLQTVYNLYPDARYTGMYQFYTPVVLVKDPELIKSITVKNFDHFTDRRTFLDPEADPVSGRNLLSLKGQRWRDMRGTLSGSFTSSKMKFIFELMNDTAQRFVEHLKNRDDVIELELKDTFTRFANDVIATSAFGLTVDSLSQPENEFYLSGKKITDFTSLRVFVKFFGYLMFPQLFRTLKIGLIDSGATRFFQKVLTETMRVREEEGIVRPDMINILLEAKKGAKDEEPVLVDTGFATVEESSLGRSKPQPAITNDDITSQALIFFFAGFDSTSTAMSFAGYELACHPEVQGKLRDEILEVQRRCEGKITYEALLGMKYLDMVVSEVLRKWPPIIGMDRVCTKPYVIEAVKPGEESVRLRVGDVVILPFQAIHRDPVNFPDPDKFDPERFSDENKGKIRPYTYLPFGVGPRNCIGSRFALLEVKMLLFNLLAAFEVVPTARSVIPLRLAKRSLNIVVEDGLWFGLKRLERTKQYVGNLSRIRFKKLQRRVFPGPIRPRCCIPINSRAKNINSQGRFIYLRCVRANDLILNHCLLIRIKNCTEMLLLLALFAILIWYFLVRPHHYWTRIGVKQTKPWPILGDTWVTIIKRMGIAPASREIYNMVNDVRYFGMYQFYMPALAIKDPDLIKEITVKRFDHFTDHRGFLDSDADPNWGKLLFQLRGQEWKRMRSCLSCAFTSSKIKSMFQLISQGAENFVRHYSTLSKDLIDVEVKDAFSRFSNDVIASMAFGVEVNSLAEPNNEFYLMGKQLTSLSGPSTMLKFFGYIVCPKLMKFFQASVFDGESSEYFKRVISEAISVARGRRQLGIERPDVINILLDAKSDDEAPVDTGFATARETDFVTEKTKSLPTITDADIISQALLFFLAGFETVSTALSFGAYELALNLDIQQKLRNEIVEVKDRYDAKITYDTLLGMKYLDMVVSEILRKWPPGPATDRVCTKPYTIEPLSPDEVAVKLNKGDLVLLPTYGLHMDPRYYPEPDKFDPERFSDENKVNISPYTYMPFGIGPRGCVASRFALLEIKIVLYHLLSEFELVPLRETQIPLQFDSNSLGNTVKGDLRLGFKRIVMK